MLFSRHARKHFSQAEGSQLDEVRQVMGMLAFPPDTHISPYKVTCAQGPRGCEGPGHQPRAGLFPLRPCFAVGRQGQRSCQWFGL